MNWFQRHLNLTWVFVYLVLGSIVMATPFGILNVVCLVFILIVSGWVIKQKGRSLWWLLIGFSPLVLKNMRGQKETGEEILETSATKSQEKSVAPQQPLPPGEKAKVTVGKLKIVTGILIVTVIVLIVGFVPLKESTQTVKQPLTYQATTSLKQEQLDSQLRSMILSTVAFSKDQEAINTALEQANQQFLVGYVSVWNKDTVSGNFNVHIVFHSPGGYQSDKNIILQLKPGE